jgi:hypothetical protein
VRESFLCKIVEVGWPDDTPFAYHILFYSIYRKYVSEGGEVFLTHNAEALTEWTTAHIRPGGGVFDVVTKMNITYANFFWPAPPFPSADDRPPNMGHDNFAVLPGVTGAPSLPGLVGGAGWPARSGAGSVPSFGNPGGNQGADQSPNIRAVANGLPMAAVPKRPELFPDPPSYTRRGVTYVQEVWQVPRAVIQIYGLENPYSPEVSYGGINHDQPTLQAYTLDFANTRIEFSGGKRSRAIAYAPVPKQEGLVLFEPPFSDSPETAIAVNSGLHRADFHIVCEPMADEEKENDSVGNGNRGQLAGNADWFGDDPLVPEPE